MRSLAAVLLMFLVAGAPSPAKAHPHTWIDYIVQVKFDDKGRITGLHETWLFDAYYTMFVVEGAQKLANGAPPQESLDAVLAENIKNLGEYAYFTHVHSGETRLKTELATDATTRMVGDRLEMSFFVPLSEPIEANDLAFVYSIYDPSYYVEMLHVKGKGSVELVGAPKGCKYALKKPNPTMSETMFAASIPPSEQGYDGLGRVFAETVRVTCG